MLLNCMSSHLLVFVDFRRLAGMTISSSETYADGLWTLDQQWVVL